MKIPIKISGVSVKRILMKVVSDISTTPMNLTPYSNLSNRISCLLSLLNSFGKFK